ncbi:FlgO family outer membrane protein [Pseudoalteromonas sp. OOF1S-7]|uniref:FlgO family outer membrane protein n=1 Tax=Pseudoalteromonas sp. OOF1S-7 TaxID=2917757 RepID=UPI001EF7297A|nr:FlgO family outer membrane protein [Pseudoalteromonas sp. OOF1S-7]MCG7537835.1 FlgO family outer membrane protein [Pseudoalteromonas sp. OOF1S-7]
MKTRILSGLTLSVLMLNGCQLMGTQPPPQTVATTPMTPKVAKFREIEVLYEALEEQAPEAEQPVDPGFVSERHRKQVANYASQIALELSDSLLGVHPHSVAVTSFVSFDDTLRSSNQLGNQLSENLIHAFQKLGYAALDFKSQQQIQVTRSGDFVFSRDSRALPGKPDPSHVLSGTMIYRDRGVEVNARLLDFESRLVVASCMVTIPYFVLDSGATAAR